MIKWKWMVQFKGMFEIALSGSKQNWHHIIVVFKVFELQRSDTTQLIDFLKLFKMLTDLFIVSPPMNPERADSRPERADFRPERAWGADGWMDGWTNGRTDGWMDGRTDKPKSPVFYRTLSPLGPLPCLSFWFTTMQSRATGIADHVLPLGDLFFSETYLWVYFHCVKLFSARIAKITGLNDLL